MPGVIPSLLEDGGLPAGLRIGVMALVGESVDATDRADDGWTDMLFDVDHQPKGPLV